VEGTVADDVILGWDLPDGVSLSDILKRRPPYLLWEEEDGELAACLEWGMTAGLEGSHIFQPLDSSTPNVGVMKSGSQLWVALNSEGALPKADPYSVCVAVKLVCAAGVLTATNVYLSRKDTWVKAPLELVKGALQKPPFV
jgi:hypothetical protein